MKPLKIFLILFLTTLTQNCYGHECCKKIEQYRASIINNVLELSDEQIELQKYGIKEFKKHLSKEQKNKYKTITKLIKNDQKKHEKNYYKSNPQLQYFGNPTSCQTVNNR